MRRQHGENISVHPVLRLTELLLCTYRCVENNTDLSSITINDTDITQINKSFNGALCKKDRWRYIHADLNGLRLVQMHRSTRLHDGVPAGKREEKYPACLMRILVTYFLFVIVGNVVLKDHFVSLLWKRSRLKGSTSSPYCHFYYNYFNNYYNVLTTCN